MFIGDNMNKTELRETLFNLMLKEKEGITLEELMNKCNILFEKWEILRNLFIENLDFFDKYSFIEDIYIENDRLIVKYDFWCYLIIDLINKECILEDKEKEELFMDFRKNELAEYHDDIEELINYCLDNFEYLQYRKIGYKEKYEDCLIRLSIDLETGDIQLHFYRDDQYLYETLFINKDFTPSMYQDATRKIGKKKMMEYFSQVPNIIVPNDLIPPILEKNKILKK